MDMDEMQLDLGLSRPMPIRRYALFKDFRSVLYCEPVDETLIVYERSYPERQPIYKWRGLKRVQVHPYRPAGVETKVVFDPMLCNRSDYFHTTQFEGDVDMTAKGYTRSAKRCYLQENFWGCVEAIMFITDLERGKQIQEALWKLTPEGNRMISCFDKSGLKHRDNNAKPRCETVVLGRLAA
jgi:hypothetical protein